MIQFRVKNLSCAACAAKIESALNGSEKVESASLDFSTELLRVEADNPGDVSGDISGVVKDIVRRSDPGVEIENISASCREPVESEDGFAVRRELAGLFVFAALFAVVLIADYTAWIAMSPRVFAGFSIAVYLAVGFGVIRDAVNTVRRKEFFDENVLMVIATIGAVAIGAYSEAVAVMVFYKTGEFLQDLAVFRSRRSIRSLLAQKPAYANLATEEGIVRIAPEDANPGDVIIVKPGEKIPLDGRVIAGESAVDPSVLTGESVPKRIAGGDEVSAGEINMTGAVRVAITRPFAESSIARMLSLVENASARKSATENFITVFARYYTPAMVGLALCVAFLPPLLVPGATFEQWIYRALILLVISCPCALVISIPLGYFGGIGRASQSGILVKGSNFLDALAAVRVVVFDKTGTLTEGVFHVREVVSENGYAPEKILKLAATAQQHSNHPIARSIAESYAQGGGRLEGAVPDAHSEISGMGIKATFGDKTILVGNDALMKKENISCAQGGNGGTTAHVAVNGVYAGYIRIGDRIRPDAADAVASLRKIGVTKIMMLTGDNRAAAESVGESLGLDRVYAGLLPEDKVRIFEDIQAEFARDGKVAFVGDGINDSPVIARADVGVAMGALGSDAAIETADVVLMTDQPGKMAEAASIGRRTRVIVWQNITMALSVKAIVVILGAFGMATMWSAVFADVGTALLAVVNSTRMLAVQNPPRPTAEDPGIRAAKEFRACR